MTNTDGRMWAVLVLAASMAGCGDGDGGSGAATGSGTGTLDLGVTDAPVDEAARVVVEFTGVVLKPQEGDEIEINFDSARQIDLLALTGDESELLLDGEQLDSGRYNFIRLLVNAEPSVMDSFIELTDGTMHPLRIPSGSQSGLKLVSGFEVPEDGAAAFTIDFDLRKSVHNPPGLGGDYILRPALRLIDNSDAATLEGTVASTRCGGDPTGSAVYVFAGADVDPDDVDEIEPDPIDTAQVELNPDNGLFEYVAGFLEPGEYTAALTCEPENDDPETDDMIAFEDSSTVTLEEGQTTTLDF